MKKEEIYESCKNIDSTNCDEIINKINEITCEESICDEQKLFAIHIIISKNLNEYVSYLKNELNQCKTKLNEASSKIKNLETKYKEHLEHTQKHMEKMNNIIYDRVVVNKPKRKIIVKVKKHGEQK